MKHATDFLLPLPTPSHIPFYYSQTRYFIISQIWLYTYIIQFCGGWGWWNGKCTFSRESELGFNLSLTICVALGKSLCVLVSLLVNSENWHFNIVLGIKHVLNCLSLNEESNTAHMIVLINNTSLFVLSFSLWSSSVFVFNLTNS